jgi:hypothetical protein
MRCFITFASGDIYEKLSTILNDSILSFSKYKLIIYRPEDFDIKWEPENWQNSYIFIFKVLSCLRALETYDEVVWLDNDCLPLNNIDKIWDYKVENYPLLPKERFNNFYVWPTPKKNYRSQSFLSEAKKRIGVIDEDFDNTYLQACCMLFNKNCLDFFKEVLHHYENFDNDVYPYGDETIINCILWRDKLSGSLGDVFLCSHYFSTYTMRSVLLAKNPEEYSIIFDYNYRVTRAEDTVMLKHGISLAKHNRIGLIKNNFDKLLFFHGSKSPDLHRNYLKTLKEWIDTSEK